MSNDEMQKSSDVAVAGKQREVPIKSLFRPAIPCGSSESTGTALGGTIGFNDKLLSHSSPASEINLEVAGSGLSGSRPVAKVLCDCGPGGARYETGQCQLHRTHARQDVSAGRRPDFIRVWIQPHNDGGFKPGLGQQYARGSFLACDDFERYLLETPKNTNFVFIGDKPVPNIFTHMEQVTHQPEDASKGLPAHQSSIGNDIIMLLSQSELTPGKGFFEAMKKKRRKRRKSEKHKKKEKKKRRKSEKDKQNKRKRRRRRRYSKPKHKSSGKSRSKN
tara:strand:- start:435 stop:1262 length:828 start_codon:yes stop_codon:yes gene_type:complete